MLRDTLHASPVDTPAASAMALRVSCFGVGVASGEILLSFMTAVSLLGLPSVALAAHPKMPYARGVGSLYLPRNTRFASTTNVLTSPQCHE